MLAVVGALLAGALTTLAPCVLPLLPVIVGGSVVSPVSTPIPALVGGGSARAPEPRAQYAVPRAYVVTASLGLSVAVFTLLLRASTALIGVPPSVWNGISGVLLVLLGLVMALPSVWESIAERLQLQSRTAKRLASARRTDGTAGAVLTGAALGPVFVSCSPLYAYVVVTVLPAEPARGLVLLTAYVVGLCATLLVVALAGQRVVRRLGWAADAHSTFRRALGWIFVLVGLAVLFGLDRSLQAWVIENSPIRPWELDSNFIPASGG